jgi:hypothetical protein
MKKKLYFITTVLLSAAVLSLSSCLKDDSRYTDFGSSAPITYINLSGLAYFGQDAITDPGPIVAKKMAITVGSKTAPSTATTVTIAYDPALVTAYNKTSTLVQYLPMPTNAYKISATTATIAAGKTTDTSIVVTFDKSKLDPTKSYMLPIKIVSSPYTISGNMSIHYYHVIGNDFGGAYTHDFTRTPPANFTGHTDIFFPDSPTQFEVAGGYFTAAERYVVSYTETGTYPNATYSDFAISINPDDVTELTTAGISITSPPAIVGYTPGQTYTYAQALQLFANGFTYAVVGGSGARVNLDQYVKQ